MASSPFPRPACIALAVALACAARGAIAQEPAPAPETAAPPADAPPAAPPLQPPVVAPSVPPTQWSPPPPAAVWPPRPAPLLPNWQHPLREMPSSLPYESGQPIPAGYAIESRKPRGLLGLGLGLLGGAWVGSMVAGSVTHAAEHKNRDGLGTLPLFIPLAGPFITFATIDPPPPSAFWLWSDGLTQVAGLAVIFAALAGDEQRLVLRDPTAHQVMGGASPNARYMWPRELRYDPTSPIPSGYHVEEREMTPLIVTGALIFGATYGVSALAALTAAVDNNGELMRLFIPVAGPLATIEPAKAEGAGVVLFVSNTIVQAAGATLFVIGAATTRQRLVRDGATDKRAERVPEPQLDIGPGRVSLRVAF